MKLLKTLFVIPILLLVYSPGFASPAEIVGVKVTNNQGSYRFDVTLRHADTGWDHYADSWEVLSPSGDILGKRVLAHPHVDEQPFTRSLSRVKIPQGTSSVFIRAHDSISGYSKKLFEVKLR
ncbi:hypothetical protein BMS3Bbin11_00685 [bacterium BMS3Bbin11]|nr:hypothetical protein BMS3Abin11_01224 [bacterium BMS3Abin11]GBE45596.1 hypothetical protein BMS3Bbin11_00685 [bacterium BMS3Bbin11]GMT41448.1 MAG: hypothetical protein IEMM0001_2183 [bacterium]HDH08671.1 hypothetical protein [Gammaproteobacteria bacterium]HDH15165.1 hypothetical protein [Gammaproteobacteria bacterium]